MRARTRDVMVLLLRTSSPFLYKGRTVTADNLLALDGESDFEGFLGQSLSSQGKYRKKSQDFDNGVPKGLGC